MIGYWLMANVWRALALVLAGFVLVLLMQIHGVPLIGGGLQPALIACRAERAAIIHAQDEAATLQAAVNEDEERRTADNAQRSDIAHAQDLERAAAAGRDYADRHRIAAGGLRPPGDRGASGQAAAAAASGGAGLPEGVPADSFVAVADPDLQACTAAVTYAVDAHNWAVTLPRSAISVESDRAD